MRYIDKKPDQKFLSKAQITQVLSMLESNKPKQWQRDHCIIYLGFNLGLRISEAASLERKHFRDIEHGMIYVPTKKQATKRPVRCDTCERKSYISAKHKGAAFCSRCGKEMWMGKPKNTNTEPPEKSPPIIEPKVLSYAKEYIASMRKDQRFLFEGHGKEHLTSRQMLRIFHAALTTAGLPDVYSYHALRHGRGVVVYEAYEDPVQVRDMLRQKSLSSAEIYIQMSPKSKAKLAAKLEEA